MKSLAKGEQGGTPPGALAPLLVMVAVAALSMLVQRRTLGAFFTPDDLVFLRMARAAESQAGAVQGWRWLSSSTFRALANGPFGIDPVPYHALNLVLLAIASALLFLLARRWGASTAAAAAGAACYGVSRVHFTALASASSHGEFLAVTLLLTALLVAARSGIRMACAAALVVAALLAKESVMLVPLAALLVPAPAAGGRSSRPAGHLLVVALASLAAGGLLLGVGRSSGALAGGAYEIAFGRNLADSLFTLLQWSLDGVRAIPDLATEPDPLAFVWGLPSALAIGALAWWSRRRAPLVAVGAAWWVLAVLPVLPLVHQTYLHYLVTPWAGFGLAIAGLADLAFAWAAGRTMDARVASLARGGALLACLIACTFALAQERLLDRRWTERLPGGDIPRDPVLRKSEFTRRVVEETAQALAGRRARVAYLVLDGAQEQLDVRSGERQALDGGAAVPVRHALPVTLDDGAVLRLLVPTVDSVLFVRKWMGPLEDFEHFYAFGDMHLQPLGRPPGAYERMALGLVGAGLPEPAVSLLDGASGAWPERPSLLWAHAIALARTGRHERARARLRDIVRIAPEDSFAVRAREALASLPDGASGAGRR
ncbi:MAG: hypothetical protein IT348_12225 [Candidatus Eisenbacteria bacterium]|nr:hypothetical protein [Candidatus Eisenbacteria bacterium]